MPVLDNLLRSIFDGKSHILYPEFKGWVQGSNRFKAFATSYQGKIRAKVKNVRDDNGKKDLRAEFEIAALLLREERFTLEYEKYPAAKQRGPDFSVTFKTHMPFNVEVRRIRKVELEAGDSEARVNKLMSVLCNKVGQMPSGVVNLLWLTAEREISEADLSQAVMTLSQLAEQKIEAFFIQRGFESASEFLHQYHKLSGVVLRQSGETVIWFNSLAQHKVSSDIATAIQRLDTL